MEKEVIQKIDQLARELKIKINNQHCEDELNRVGNKIAKYVKKNIFKISNELNRLARIEKLFIDKFAIEELNKIKSAARNSNERMIYVPKDTILKIVSTFHKAKDQYGE